jgi:hypothetical protein
MQTIQLINYGDMMAESGKPTVYNEIKKALEKNDKIQIDFSHITTITPFFAKQVFGKLYLELGTKQFYNCVALINVTNEIELLIKVEIQNAIDEKFYQLVW